MVEFPCSAFGEKPDYSNFNKSSWKMCNEHSHNAQATLFQAATTLAAQKEIKRKYGVQYSILLELPYFSAPQMCIVDPMHCLLLGTGKHMIEVWKKCSLLEHKDFLLMKERASKFVILRETQEGSLPQR